MTPKLESVTQIGCFGKLPIYDEFIRYNVSGRSALELDEWIQRGFSHHSRSIATRPEKTDLHEYIYHFVFYGSAEQQSSIIGTMMGSSDKSGRQYPFVIFKLLPIQNADILISTLPCGYRSFFDNSKSLCSTDWSLQPISMLKKRVEALNGDGATVSIGELLESEVNALQAITKKQFWCEMLLEAAQEQAPLYVEVMKDLLDTVVRRSPLRTSWGIEIPLPGNLHANEHVAFWIGAAETLLAARGWRPHFMWGDVANSSSQALYMFFRPVTPIFFSHLLGHRVDNGILINLDEECARQTYCSDSARSIGSLNSGEHMVSTLDEWSNWDRI